ncbi:hypothetical protein [Pseudoroseomonas ludipueritiae]|uniref:Uncharacterized protein n=1 Tax=Pseudoroseomonas ludipueritiae TaxID=198093 RepID=A0ABR7RBN2_9PROT|nr:hypothetical protein [Pseudoroseomonas ludipueritiae]MBC9179246.1 hypothetical protein [Pseudoroseomonas ludipueritiae]MCG7362090.1 hypothetical protein [Roseomonas sp. ACRSG]
MFKDSIALSFPERTETSQDKTLSTEFPFGTAGVTSHNEWSRKTPEGFRLHATVAEDAVSALSWKMPDPKASAKLEFQARLAVAESGPVQLKVEIRRQKRVAVSRSFDLSSMTPTPITVDIPRYKSPLEITVSAISLQKEPKPRQAVADLSEPVLKTFGKPGR